MDGSSSGNEVSPVRTGRLEALAPGQAIPFAGDRVAYVTPELAGAFRAGDRLVVVQDTGDLLHVPAREHAAAEAAVGRAAAAFARMGEVSDAAITAGMDLKHARRAVAFPSRLRVDGTGRDVPRGLRQLRAIFVGAAPQARQAAKEGVHARCKERLSVVIGLRIGGEFEKSVGRFRPNVIVDRAFEQMCA